VTHAIVNRRMRILVLNPNSSLVVTGAIMDSAFGGSLSGAPMIRTEGAAVRVPAATAGQLPVSPAPAAGAPAGPRRLPTR